MARPLRYGGGNAKRSLLAGRSELSVFGELRRAHLRQRWRRRRYLQHKERRSLVYQLHNTETRCIGRRRRQHLVQSGSVYTGCTFSDNQALAHTSGNLLKAAPVLQLLGGTVLRIAQSQQYRREHRWWHLQPITPAPTLINCLFNDNSASPVAAFIAAAQAPQSDELHVHCEFRNG